MRVAEGSLKKRNLKWIWVAQKGRRNQYAALRLVIKGLLPADIPESVPVAVSAGNLYRLYINGRYLGRGPVREWAGHAGVDRYDLYPYLQPGRNIISVLVHYLGEDAGGWQLTPPGFLLTGKIGKIVLDTGTAKWQASELDAWNPDAERINLYNGFAEDVDVGRWDSQLWELGKDSERWQPAAIVTRAGKQRNIIEPRRIPPLSEILMCPMIMVKKEPDSMLFDAGRMVSGGLHLEITADEPVELELYYSDRLHRGRIDINNDIKNGNSSKDRLAVPAGRHEWYSSFVLRGYRYVRLSWKGKAPLKAALQPCEITYPCVNRAVFESDEPWLNNCWETSRLTARLCMAETYMDNPSRERQQYGGDGYIQALYGFNLFGDLALWRQFLRHYSQGRRKDGAYQSGGPWCWNQIIPAWTLLWIESIGEYYRHTRDKSVALEYADDIIGALDWFTPMTGPDGLLTINESFNWEGGDVLWNFIDWQKQNEQLRGEDARLALNGLYVMAMKTASRLLNMAGRKKEATAIALRCGKISKHLSMQACLGEHALVAATLASSIKGRMGNVAELIEDNRSTTDVMYLFFTLKALVIEGYNDMAMLLLRQIFNPMMESEYGTFWEARVVPRGSSRAICQAIGGAPAYWLPRLTAGIKEIDALERRITFGRPLRTVGSAHIRIPCIDGDINIRTAKGRIERISLPRGWTAK